MQKAPATHKNRRELFINGKYKQLGSLAIAIICLQNRFKNRVDAVLIQATDPALLLPPQISDRELDQASVAPFF